MVPHFQQPDHVFMAFCLAFDQLGTKRGYIFFVAKKNLIWSCMDPYCPCNWDAFRDFLLSYRHTSIARLSGWLRAQIGFVEQEPVLFDRPLTQNISYGSASGSCRSHWVWEQSVATSEDWHRTEHVVHLSHSMSWQVHHALSFSSCKMTCISVCKYIIPQQL